MRDHLQAIGLEECALLDVSGNPIVYGEWVRDEDAPTLLLYGHYDVQPADPWGNSSPGPFEPKIVDNAIHARGSSDNKGPFFAYVTALETLLAVDGRLPCNVRVVVEGNEETSPDPLAEFIDNHRERLSSCDACVISDGAMLAVGKPSITVSLRGLAALQIRIDTLREDVHSGMYGGVAPNAIHAMAALLAGLHGEHGDVAVAGFGDDVAEPAEATLASWRALEPDVGEMQTELGSHRLSGRPDRTMLERLWACPTLEVNGVWGGYTGEGVKTVIPASAWAKITCRLVANQDAGRVLDSLERHLRVNCPDEASLVVESTLAGANPVSVRGDSALVRAAREALKDAYGVEAAVVGNGGSMPVVSLMSEQLGLDCVLMGFALPTDGAHGPNERFELSEFDRGARAVIAFLRNAGK